MPANDSLIRADRILLLVLGARRAGKQPLSLEEIQAGYYLWDVLVYLQRGYSLDPSHLISSTGTLDDTDVAKSVFRLVHSGLLDVTGDDVEVFAANEHSFHYEKAMRPSAEWRNDLDWATAFVDVLGSGNRRLSDHVHFEPQWRFWSKKPGSLMEADVEGGLEGSSDWLNNLRDRGGTMLADDERALRLAFAKLLTGVARFEADQ
ncbi:hypothetical protein [Serinicoccus sp. CUA-874]|uniref:hypothetical protein n=1 Tax=Serinicoccus sp. CUA-874 TaxID=1517939 RepID=UPI00130162F9|nr:hypothetical protein [Serinicoccus sp. CUA-874]